jgi:hypothetical protein
MNVHEIRSMIRTALKEDGGASSYPPEMLKTVPAAQSAQEKSMDDELKAKGLRTSGLRNDPISQKSTMVANVLSGRGANVDHQKVKDALKSIDPSEIMIATADELADRIVPSSKKK